ncbi:hypothetical protein DLM78_02290 [Leptospira stimsonii]|uniref:Uncharacterized protein n=1 Tax=Leptospira stimsonii TaxID=2202203 RepID=A0A8B3CWL3_9LEPT|nr:hypothetical protein DLM78_02290 [Leptospira stimsonii]
MILFGAFQSSFPKVKICQTEEKDQNFTNLKGKPFVFLLRFNFKRFLNEFYISILLLRMEKKFPHSLDTNRF